MTRAARRAAKAHRQRDSRQTAAQRVAARRPDLEKVQQGWVASEQQLYEVNGRIALALSIVQHRHFCPDCRPHVEQARLALLGQSIDEIMGEADAATGPPVVSGVRGDAVGPEDSPADTDATLGVDSGARRSPRFSAAWKADDRTWDSYDDC